MGFSKFLYDMFEQCLNQSYTHTENGASFSFFRDHSTLYIFFEKSNGAVDWKSNFNYRAVKYPQDNKRLYCHEGFLAVWLDILPYLVNEISDKSVKEIVSVGYSHGAGVALLSYEYCRYVRSDIQDKIFGFGFGSPRVIWGKSNRRVWDGFFVIKNIDDLITHLPPSIFGYRHVGHMITIGQSGKYSKIDAHRQENYLYELKNSQIDFSI